MPREKMAPLWVLTPPGGPIHFSLGAHAQGLELRQDLPGRSLRVGQSPPGASAEVSPQGADTVQKGEEIHVPVGAAVVPVHQSRLGRDRDLVEQGPLGGRADASSLAATYQSSSSRSVYAFNSSTLWARLRAHRAAGWVHKKQRRPSCPTSPRLTLVPSGRSTSMSHRRLAPP